MAIVDDPSKVKCCRQVKSGPYCWLLGVLVLDLLAWQGQFGVFESLTVAVGGEPSAWWMIRLITADATVWSPKTSPHRAIGNLDVRTMEACS